jgi:putative polymerase
MTSILLKPAAEATDARYLQATGELLAPVIAFAAVLYNFVLCFVNTKLHGVDPGIVISTEIVLIAAAFILVWNCSRTLYVILILVAAYFYAVMLVRSEFDAKILRDILIPIAFFFLGRHLGSLRSADKLVTVLLVVALSVALFEWLAVDSFLHYFDVSRYYIARGTATAEEHLFEGFFNSTRFDSRTLLPFLGDHRVSGIFLEAPSVGNFGAIIFAWILLRPHGWWTFVAKTVAILALVVLADARFGLYFGAFTLALYLFSRFVRPTMLFVAPFVAMIALVIYASVAENQVLENDMLGRFLYAGRILSNIDPSRIFGLQASDISSGVRFASDPVNDAPYTYVLVKVGIFGAAALWALFTYMPVFDKDASRFKSFVAFYYTLVLTIAASAFTIKTAALLWFLCGALNNPTRSFFEAGANFGGQNDYQRWSTALRRSFHKLGRSGQAQSP